MQTEFLIVKNNIIAKTKYGEKRVINFTNGEATWINDTNAMIDIKPNQKIEVVRDPKKNTLTILDREETITMNRPSSNGSEGNGSSYYTHTHSSNTSNKEETVLDLPELSDIDKRKMMEYVRSQSRLLKFCYETICQDFPTLEEYDSRGARSLAITLLIAANQARDKYMK
jgi:hypothetical protein